MFLIPNNYFITTNILRKYFPKDYTQIMIVLPNYSTKLSKNKFTQSYYNYMKKQNLPNGFWFSFAVAWFICYCC